MKKLINAALIVVLVLSLCTQAFALAPTSGESSMDVPATYIPGEQVNAGNIYSVDLVWSGITSLVFKDGTQTYTWNTETHKYDMTEASDAAWTTGTTSVKITVTNSSNADVRATAAYSDNASDKAVTAVTWTANGLTAESAAKGIDFTDTVTEGAATQVVLTGTVSVTSGTIDKTASAVGTITVTLD